MNKHFRVRWGVIGICALLTLALVLIPVLSAQAAYAWYGVGGGTQNGGLVYATAVDSAGNLYVGGVFTHVNGGSQNIPYLARWNGTTWTALGSGINGPVYALKVGPDGYLYVGGRFTNAGGVPANNIARWNGSTWSALGIGTSGGPMVDDVRALAFLSNGNLVAGGLFLQAGGVTVNYIARWNGSTWSAFGPGVNDAVYAVAVNSLDQVVIGGIFNSTSDFATTLGSVGRWNGNWTPVGISNYPNGSIHTIVVDSADTIFVGGQFAGFSGSATPANHIARYRTIIGSWEPLDTGVQYLPSPPGGGLVGVYALALSGNDLYVGGLFNRAGVVSGANSVARWNNGQWYALGSGIGAGSGGLLGYVRALALWPYTVYTGGEFGLAGGATAYSLAKYSDAEAIGTATAQTGATQTSIAATLTATSWTRTPTRTNTPTNTNTPTQTATATNTPTPTLNLTQTAQAAGTQTAQAGATQTAQAGATQTAQAGATQTAQAGATQTAQVGATQTAQAGATQTAQAGATQTAQVGATQTAEVEMTQTAAAWTDTPTVTTTPTPTPTPTITYTATPTADLTQTAQVWQTQTAQVGATQTAQVGATQTAQVGATQTAVVALTQTAAAWTPTPNGPGVYLTYIPLMHRRFVTPIEVLESEPNDIFADADVIQSLPALVHGHHDGSAGTGDVFQLTLEAGEILYCGITSDDPTGLQLLLYNAEGVEVARVVDAPYDLEAVAVSTGTYYLYLYTPGDTHNQAVYKMSVIVKTDNSIMPSQGVTPMDAANLNQPPKIEVR